MAALPPRQPSGAGPRLDLAQLLTRADRLLDRRLRLVLEAAGHTVDGWRVLSLLADDAGHPMTEVAAQVFLPPASLTKLIDHLVDDNLVYRRVDELDRRRIRAFLTARGRALHLRLRTQLVASLAEIALPAAEQELLGSLLSRFGDALSELPAVPADH